MNGLLILYQFVRADFLERIRRYSFLITLAAALCFGYLAVPPAGSKIATLALGNIRGIYNTPWVAAMVAIMCSCFLSFIGFYLVKNSLARDKVTRVVEILTSSPISTFTYLLGKALSNLALLATLVFVVMLSVIPMQFIRGEDTSIQIGQLIAPFLLMTLPFMAVVAALAVLFEALPVLRGTAGNVIWFFVWMFMIMTATNLSALPSEKIVPATNDLPGWTVILNSMTTQVVKFDPGYQGELMIGGWYKADQEVRTMVWDGVNWTVPMAAARCWWLLGAVGVVGLASVFYRRQEGTKSELSRKPATATPIAVETGTSSATGTSVHLRSLKYPLDFSLQGLVVGELRLAFSSVGRYWYLIALGLLTAEFFAPVDVSRRYLLPVAWLWPLPIWSAMGCRERIFGTEQLVFSTIGMGRRQLSALLIAAVAVAVLTGLGVFVRFSLAGDWGGLLSWVGGVIVIPATAISLGVVSGGRKLFEAVYTLVWYIGPLNGLPHLDFMGVTKTSAQIGVPIYCLILSLLMMSLAWAKRSRQMS